MKRLIMAAILAATMVAGCVTTGVNWKYGKYSGSVNVNDEMAAGELSDAENEFGVKIEY